MKPARLVPAADQFIKPAGRGGRDASRGDGQ
jgi:hypothetical protein